MTEYSPAVTASRLHYGYHRTPSSRWGLSAATASRLSYLHSPTRGESPLFLQRTQQVFFIVSLLALNWLLMMAVHEFGHVIGAWLTGGVVEKVVLHPLTISRTDVSPNPNRAVVVWLGPVVGSILPMIGWMLVPRSWERVRQLAMFFAGFCLVANGAYIGIGVFDQVGDCREMLKTGSAIWMLLLFGAVAVSIGFYLWHRLGSLRQFLVDRKAIDSRITWSLIGALALVIVSECAFSPT